MPGSLFWFTSLAPLGYLALVGLLAALSGVAAWVLHLLVVRREAPLWLTLPAVWTVLEWLPSLAGPLAFPWLGLGTSLTGFPELLAPAEVGGILAVTFWVSLVNGVMADGIRSSGLLVHGPVRAVHASGLRRWAPLMGLPFVLGIPAAWGIHRAAGLDLEPGARIAALHLPMPAEPLDRHARAREAMAHGNRLLEGLEPGSVDLIVWPEASVPLALDGAEGAPFFEELSRHAARLDATLLVGAYLEEGAARNALIFIGPDGEVDHAYAKRRLVPGVEGRFQAGRQPEVKESHGLLVGGLVCWDVAFGGLAREARLAGARLLANGSNDSFLEFPEAGSWTGWAARRQHEAHLIVRAVETRMGAVRAATAGGTFLVDPVGRVTDRAMGPGAALVVGEVTTTATHSPYVRVGIGGGGPAIILLLLLGWGAGGKRKVHRNGGRDGDHNG